MGFSDTGAKVVPLFVGTTNPAAGTAVIGTPLVGIAQFNTALIVADLIGATGGTLDITVQTSIDAQQDGTGRWIDLAHYTQLAAGGGAASWTSGHTRGFGTSTAPAAANPTSATPTLAANTIRPDFLGIALRVVAVAGAGTSAGAAISIKVLLSKS